MIRSVSTTRLAVLGGLLIALLAGLVSAPAYAQTSRPPIPPGNWVWYYQPVTPSDGAKFIGARGVVVGTQPDDSVAISRIHEAGALAIHYVNPYWYPVGRPYQGSDLAEHPDWAFCQSGSTPMWGRDFWGTPWDYVDLNEQAMHDQVIAWLQHLKQVGYDGVFFDIGSRAMWRGPMPHLKSTCTQDPVQPGATFAQAYAHIVEQAHAMGLRVILNYGMGPSLSKPLAASVDRLLHETSSHTRPSVGQFLGLQSDQARTQAGQPGYIEELKTKQSNDRSTAYYEWAEGWLYNVDLDFNSGDSGCPAVLTPGAVCWHYGTFPELTALKRGGQLDAAPTRTHCSAHHKIECLWTRRWQDVVVTVNETRRPITTTITTGHPTPRVLTNAWNRAPLANGAAITRARVTIPAYSGRIFVESR